MKCQAEKDDAEQRCKRLMQSMTVAAEVSFYLFKLFYRVITSWLIATNAIDAINQSVLEKKKACRQPGVAKRGKSCNLCQTRENVQVSTSAAKRVTNTRGAFRYAKSTGHRSAGIPEKNGTTFSILTEPANSNDSYSFFILFPNSLMRAKNRFVKNGTTNCGWNIMF